MKEDDIIVAQVNEGNVVYKLMIAVYDYPANPPLTRAPVITGYICTSPLKGIPFLSIDSVIINSVEIEPVQKNYSYRDKKEINLKQVKTDFIVAAEMLRAKFPKV